MSIFNLRLYLIYERVGDKRRVIGIAITPVEWVKAVTWAFKIAEYATRGQQKEKDKT